MQAVPVPNPRPATASSPTRCCIAPRQASLARPARTFRSVDDRLQPVQPLVCGDIWEVLFAALRPKSTMRTTRDQGARHESAVAKDLATQDLLECFFHRLKRFRGITTRYEKIGRDVLAQVQFARTMLRLELD